MRIRGTALLSAVWSCAVCTALSLTATGGGTGGHPQSDPRHSLSVSQRLNTRVELFDTAGQTFAQALLGLAYEYKLPMGVEYWSKESTHVPLKLQLRNRSVQEILETLATEQPGYRVSFPGGVVQVYASRGRSDPSNLLNTIIPRFRIMGEDPAAASAQAFEALVHVVSPGTSVIESTAVGSPLRVSLDLRNARVYEILNAIVAQDGAAVWVVRVPPDKLSVLKGDLWYLYPLDAAFKEVVLQDVRSLFPDGKGK